jgi:hypothetical protein
MMFSRFAATGSDSLFSVFFCVLCVLSQLPLHSLGGGGAIPSDLKPFGVEYAGFIRAFVSVCAEIIALSL